MDDTKIKNFTSCYKEQKFLEFFFKNLRINKPENRHSKEFPFVSYCGIERNYLKCDDLPFVITRLDENNDLVQINHINSAHWLFKFEPNDLFHDQVTGRLYYLFENKQIIKEIDETQETIRRFDHFDKLPCKIALVKSDLSIYLMEKTEVDEKSNTIKFVYKGKTYELNNNPLSKAFKLLNKFSSMKM